MIAVMFTLSLLPFFGFSEIQEIDSNKFSEFSKQNKILFLGYLVSWCPFSNAMKPVLANADKELKAQPTLADSVEMAIVDCIVHSEFCDNNGVFKFPTMLVYSHGIKVTEYRGERSVEALMTYLRDVSLDKSVRLTHVGDLESLKQKRNNFLVGFFSKTPPGEIASFVGLFRDFYIAENLVEEMQNGESIRYYNGKEDTWLYFDGELTDFPLLGDWVKKVSREKIVHMTFQNAEEITGERKPLIILFLSQNKEKILESFDRQYDALFYQIADKVNFVHLDCEVFKHPLFHVGKGVKDCPLLVIDSLSHMYLFPGSVEEAFNTDMGELVEFVNDFFSGKLHKELHQLETKDMGKSDNVFKNYTGGSVTVKESKFKKLAPSSLRYSFVDEL